MGIIKVMDESLSNKIAAGEVVERVSNVVKELVENSIDAGSSSIKIELINSGIKSIVVIDNGVGMSKEDAILCFGRHATSKIKKEADLYFINTLGFRGEALASISSVSKVNLETFNGEESTKIILEGGKVLNVESGSSHKGTIIEVKDIFYNTPVRLKFLKSEQSELSSSVSIIESISLSHPNISFSLYNNGKEIIKTTGSNDLLKVIHEIYGYNVSKNMYKISGSNYDYEIDGYISNISISKSNKNGLVILVNGRVVQNSSIVRIIKDAYHTFLAENKFPYAVININTDPTLIDVNIHPTKQDIKFSKIDSLEDLLFNSIRNKLNNTNNIVKAYEEKETVSELDNKQSQTEEVSYEDLEPQNFYEEMTLNFGVKENSVDYEVKSDNNLIKPVGLSLGTYLIAQEEDIMYMIDIHAANERINYEYTLENLKKQNKNSISLLFPINIELSKSNYIIMKEYEYLLSEMGFAYEEFGVNTYRVLAHPIWLKEGCEEEAIRKIFDLIIELKGKFDRVRFNERVAMTMACKMSVKANTNISYSEQEILIERLFNCEFPYTCPHGRPTIVKYPKYELEKLFKRVD